MTHLKATAIHQVKLTRLFRFYMVKTEEIKVKPG